MPPAPDAPAFHPFALSPDGWFDLLPTGEFPNTSARPNPDGTTTITHALQVITPADLQAILGLWEEQGRPELLIDREHLSTSPSGDSTAMGFLQSLRLSPDGTLLQGLPRWSDLGHSLLTGGQLRRHSPNLNTRPIAGVGGDGSSPQQPLHVRPFQLTRLALTNDPAIFTPDMVPIANSLLPLSPTPPTPTNNTTKNMDPKELAALLGLPETATPDEIKAALKALQEAKMAADNDSAEVALQEYANIIPAASREFFKGILLTNRKETLETLAAIKAKATPAPADPTPAGYASLPLHNKSANPAQAPAALTNSQPDFAARTAAQRSLILEIQNKTNKPFESAFEIAQQTNPTLFA